METRGTKRPLDEHAWESDKCTICKARAQFRVLHPECKHGICDECIPKTARALCETCNTDWEYNFKGLTAPCGGLVVAAFTPDGEVCISDFLHFYPHHKRYLDRRPTDYTCKQLAAESPSMAKWMRENGLIRQRDITAKLAKYTGLFGKDSYVEKVSDTVYVVYMTNAPEASTYNVVLITPEQTHRIKVHQGQVVNMPRRVPLEYMEIMARAVLHADALNLAAEPTEIQNV